MTRKSRILTAIAIIILGIAGFAYSVNWFLDLANSPSTTEVLAQSHDGHIVFRRSGATGNETVVANFTDRTGSRIQLTFTGTVGFWTLSYRNGDYHGAPQVLKYIRNYSNVNVVIIPGNERSEHSWIELIRESRFSGRGVDRRYVWVLHHSGKLDEILRQQTEVNWHTYRVRIEFNEDHADSLSIY